MGIHPHPDGVKKQMKGYKFPISFPEGALVQKCSIFLFLLKRLLYSRTDCDTTVHRHCFGPWMVGYSQKLSLRRSAFCSGALYFLYFHLPTLFLVKASRTSALLYRTFPSILMGSGIKPFFRYSNKVGSDTCSN